MPMLFDFNQLTLGKSTKGGHLAFPDARYLDQGAYKKVVYKENKNGDSYFSFMEVAFGGLAARFLQPNLTFQQQGLVTNNNNIEGLLFEHLCYPIARRETGTVFYKIEKAKNNTLHIASCAIETPEAIPVHFFDKYPGGFFTKLLELYKNKEVSFDMDSLASVLTTSYTLEEDDLHQGNFGFYMVEKNQKPHVVFFKIDHDLMMCDSLMSHGYARLVNWRLHKHSFAVTQRDLLHFPKLFDSNNYYWPTTMRYLVNHGDPKVFCNQSDFDSFSSLGQLEAFKKAKWRAFYKHILIPSEVIAQSMTLAYDNTNPEGRAQIALITNAVVARQAQLQAVLFSLPEFRQFIASMDEDQFESIKKEIFFGVDDALKNQFKPNLFRNPLDLKLLRHQQLCQSSEEGFDPEDTPLHVAIRMGDYRYLETWDLFEKFANTKNKAGHTPLDIAVKMAKNFQQGQDHDIRNDPFNTIKHLLEKGVDKTKTYKAFKQQLPLRCAHYHFKSPFVTQASQATGIKALLTVFQGLSEEVGYPLKNKKEIALECMKAYIHSKPDDLKTVLVAFKTHLNGNASTAPAPELQFIRQLRSDLWIVRQIRGLLGGTATQVALNELLDNSLNPLSTKQNKACFFQAVGTNNQKVIPKVVNRIA